MKIISEGFARLPPHDDIERQAHADDDDIFLTFVEPLEPLPSNVTHFPPGNHFVISVPPGTRREPHVKGQIYRVRVTVEVFEAKLSITDPDDLPPEELTALDEYIDAVVTGVYPTVKK